MSSDEPSDQQTRSVCGASDPDGVTHGCVRRPGHSVEAGHGGYDETGVYVTWYAADLVFAEPLRWRCSLQLATTGAPPPDHPDAEPVNAVAGVSWAGDAIYVLWRWQQ